MKKIVIGLLVLGLTNLSIAQQDNLQAVELEGVIVSTKNLDYVNLVKTKHSKVINNLENKAAQLNISDVDGFIEDQEMEINLKSNNGSITATYNEEGEIINVNERFKNVLLPYQVRNEVYIQYPGYTIIKDSYRVSFTKEQGALKIYKIHLSNGSDRVKIKLDDQGNSINNAKRYKNESLVSR